MNLILVWVWSVKFNVILQFIEFSWVSTESSLLWKIRLCYPFSAMWCLKSHSLCFDEYSSTWIVFQCLVLTGLKWREKILRKFWEPKTFKKICQSHETLCKQVETSLETRGWKKKKGISATKEAKYSEVRVQKIHTQ